GGPVAPVAALEDARQPAESERAGAVEIEDPEPGAVAQQRIEISWLRAVVWRGALAVLERDDGSVPRDRLERSLQHLALRALDVDLDQRRHVARGQRVVEAVDLHRDLPRDRRRRIVATAEAAQ